MPKSKPEDQQPTDDPSDEASATIDETATRVVKWRDRDWVVPATPDEWDIDATEAFGDLAASTDVSLVGFRHVSAFLRSVLGPQQYGALRTGQHRKTRDANDLFNTIMAAYGERNPGE